MSASDEEYKMLRTEILQYLQHYQNIRTFMFTSVTAIFIFLFKSEVKEPLVYLVPLLVVIPAYLSAVNYWSCVTVDSAYLMVFHEEQEDSNFHWETRLTQFSDVRNEVLGKGLIGNIQALSYILATLLCFAVYGYFLHKKGSQITCFDICGGLIIAVICILIFIFVTVGDKEVYVERWRRIKRN